MTSFDWIQTLVLLALIVICVQPLGVYMSRVFQGQIALFAPVENLVFRLLGLQRDQEENWVAYAKHLLAFNLFGLVFSFLLLRFQSFVPFLNDAKADLSTDAALNIAASFVTNTNWQALAGEAALSRFSQIFVLNVQNFLSAATGLAVLIALVRGFARKKTDLVGCFYTDLVRGILFVLLPLSFAFAVFLCSQGVVQSLHDKIVFPWIDPGMLAFADQQEIPMGPVASQTAIQMIGTNGGGFFNANMAHPFANPTPLTNFLAMFAMLLIPASLCLTFGDMAQDKKQGWVIFGVMLAMLIPFAALAIAQETAPVALTAFDAPMGNIEGKETRFGAFASALWATLATGTSSGATNAALDSFRPLAGLAPLALIHLGEVAFGGIGSGLYGMLIYILLAVFVAGLMVGRTPEFLGKKIGVFEMKMASLFVLLPPMCILIGTAFAVSCEAGVQGATATGPHGFTQILYAFSSAAGNNGSAFAGLNGNTPFYNVSLALVMLIGRFGVMIPVLALAGCLAEKAKIPPSAGTLSTKDPLFVLFLIVVVFLVGILTFVPALALGPVVEHLTSVSLG